MEVNKEVRLGALDLLRVMAAFSVVLVHVLWPYRELLGEISDNDWLAAVVLNCLNRWGVPAFIMITGALLLSDQTPFDPLLYCRKRVMKVVVPFLSWSLVYALFSAFSGWRFDIGVFWQTVLSLPKSATYYHLDFFYYFIPLYVVIPFLRPWVQAADGTALLAVNLCWGALCLLRLFGFELGLFTNLAYYSGYLVLGYSLIRYPAVRAWSLPLGLVSMAITSYMVVAASFDAGLYLPQLWLSYQTLNTVFIAAMMFSVAFQLYAWIDEYHCLTIRNISRHSLGIYLIHPLLLVPLHWIDATPAQSWLAIPAISALVFLLSFYLSRLMARYRSVSWLVP
ncbi:acyltransferase [Veronia pacifica]|uniref:Acyltransferase 3 domain-containing protein n=1 Tax=Veronia pacifica TaxID=1080227 RepID=A0A1C3EJ46_9GAMM|nr:acyltransferase family protein [Veronia pacifica]ODA33248.1 hypothetical protein A8L45_10605 [Veronia pacifica]